LHDRELEKQNGYGKLNKSYDEVIKAFKSNNQGQLRADSQPVQVKLSDTDIMVTIKKFNVLKIKEKLELGWRIVVEQGG